MSDVCPNVFVPPESLPDSPRLLVTGCGIIRCCYQLSHRAILTRLHVEL